MWPLTRVWPLNQLWLHRCLLLCHWTSSILFSSAEEVASNSFLIAAAAVYRLPRGDSYDDDDRSTFEAASSINSLLTHSATAFSEGWRTQTTGIRELLFIFNNKSIRVLVAQRTHGLGNTPRCTLPVINSIISVTVNGLQRTVGFDYTT